MANQPVPEKPNTGSESAASWNCKYLDASGFDCMLTLRSDSGQKLLVQAAAAVKFLIESGATPTRLPAGSAPALATPAHDPANGSPDPSWCAIHSVAMQQYEKDGRTWYSHKLPNGDGFCKGKPPKK